MPRTSDTPVTPMLRRCYAPRNASVTPTVTPLPSLQNRTEQDRTSEGVTKERYTDRTVESAPILVVLALPPKALSPNARVHWGALARAKRSYRMSAWALALEATACRRPNHARATVQCTFYHRTARRRDGDNLLASLKAAFDGIAEAGIVANDSGMRHLPVIQQIDTRNPRVEIAIFPISAETPFSLERTQP